MSLDLLQASQRFRAVVLDDPFGLGRAGLQAGSEVSTYSLQASHRSRVAIINSFNRRRLLKRLKMGANGSAPDGDNGYLLKVLGF